MTESVSLTDDYLKSASHEHRVESAQTSPFEQWKERGEVRRENP